MLQVSFAVEQAHRQGIRNQLVDFPLPVAEAQYGMMGDSQGFAGGVSESFRAARPTVERFLMALKQKEGLQVTSWQKLAALLPHPCMENATRFVYTSRARWKCLEVYLDPAPFHVLGFSAAACVTL